MAWTPPYSVVFSFTTPDMQMVVVPAMSTRATTDMAKVSFTVLPKGSRQNGQVNPVSGSIGAVPRSGYTCD
ncbi:hypothetical protein C7399_101458 [Paraburkholderia tropica]|uniref:Uncharacterized protein n=1 Tax=Paraburkholderia tropica TaxID=92647 RepID=A0AAQ1JSI1_9BURK|nr:hypothetical protein C7400_101458 [Paraburkholderia tropica]PZW89805.1 hypothetical protein C7399_101458 [Paraburkholderia tropica]SEJ07576.1 hypothetical protein SAMN05216550_102321 [Paraburkholderia tropica]